MININKLIKSVPVCHSKNCKAGRPSTCGIVPQMTRERRREHRVAFTKGLQMRAPEDFNEATTLCDFIACALMKNNQAHPLWLHSYVRSCYQKCYNISVRVSNVQTTPIIRAHVGALLTPYIFTFHKFSHFYMALNKATQNIVCNVQRNCSSLIFLQLGASSRTVFLSVKFSQCIIVLVLLAFIRNGVNG